MTTRQLAALLLKLFGLAMVVTQAAHIAGWVFTLVSSNRLMSGDLGNSQDGLALMLISVSGLFVLAGGWLVARGDAVAERLVPVEVPIPAADTMPAGQLMQIGLACAGAWQATSGAAGLADWCVKFAVVVRSEKYASTLMMLNQVGPSGFVEPAVRLALGLTLLLAPAWVMVKLRLPRS